MHFFGSFLRRKKSAAFVNAAAVNERGCKVDKPRAAQAAGGISAYDVVQKSAVVSNMAHGSVNRCHSAAYAGALERRPRRNGAAYKAVASAESHLAVCADIEKQTAPRLFINPG